MKLSRKISKAAIIILLFTNYRLQSNFTIIII